jgi:uncharacterized damage-inducible protein DinB
MSDLSELLERFRRGPELVAIAITGAAGSELDFAPSGKWSVRQILAHLSDAEMVAAARCRRIIAENNPTLMAYDQEAWASNLDYHRRKTSQSLETFRRIRSENYDLLKELPEAAFDRTGNHSERGQLTLRQLLSDMTEHAEKHTGQLQAVRAAYKQSKAVRQSGA